MRQRSFWIRRTIRTFQPGRFSGQSCVVGSFHDKAEAIARANALPYAFQASVHTNDLNDALVTSQKLDASTVMINDHRAIRVDCMPFGGRNVSSLGLGGIQNSMHDMTREKMLVIKSGVL